VRSLSELLSELRGLGVALSIDGDQLRVRAPKGTLTRDLTAELQQRKPQLIEYLRQAAASATASSDDDRIAAAPISAKRRLSFAQERLWFLDQLEGRSPAYNMPLAARLQGRLDRAALQRALDEIVRRHQILRSNFVAEGDEPVVVTREQASCSFAYFDRVPASLTERELMRAEAGRSFDLQADPLIRASLYRETDTSHLLFVTMHHIVSDGWSLGVFCRELALLYEAFDSGATSPLPELSIQYGDYAAWQRSHVSASALQQQLEFWRGALRGAPDAINLPLDHPRPAVQTYRGGSHSFVIDSATTTRLRERCAEFDVTLFMTLLAGFAAVLSRYSGQQEVVIGTAVANRRPETESLIGLFVNTLALRINLSGDPSVRDLLARVRETCLAAYEHQELPFEQVVDAVKPVRHLSHAPLFQVSFDVQDDAAAEVRMHDVALVAMEQQAVSSKFDLGLSIEPSADHLTCTLSFNSDLFEPATIERLCSHVAVLLGDLAAHPDARLSQLRMMTEAEWHQVVHGWNATAQEFPAHATLPELIDAQARATPDRVAVVAGNDTLTYAELIARANQLANYLLSQGVTRESLVAIAVDRSTDLVIGLLGIMKTGAAYVPIEPSYPRARIAGMLDDAQPSVIVTHSSVAPDLPPANAKLVSIDRIGRELDRCSPDLSIAGPVADGVAYVIYTSGSTGQPKGVQVTHRPLVNFLHSMRRAPGLADRDVVLAVTTISFDIAALELYLPLVVGARVVVADRAAASDPQRLAAAIEDHGVTFMQATPATWRMLVDSGWRPALPLRIASGGEALPSELAARLRNLGLELWNLYGPTETTIWSAAGRVEHDRRDGVEPIGAPIGNTQLYVLDANLSPQPVGVPGELYIGGEGLARGYLHRPDLTADRYSPDPFASGPGARMYRTGDLVRRLAGGDIEFMGRVDNQVKIRGFRIELGEIEWALARHDAVGEAVVVARPDGAGELQLVAYVVAAAQAVPGAEELRAFLTLRLPEFMIPATIIALDALPRTPNGKIDRPALPAPDRSRPELRAVYQPPRTETERSIAAIWQGALDVDRVGIDDNFFDLGGHSLLMTRVHARLRAAFDTPLPLVELFQYPTVRTLAARIAPAESSLASKPARATRSSERRDVAIIGLAGRFPGADDLETFWRNLREGRESISFFSDDELLASGVEPELIADPNYVRANGILSDVTTFDAPFFGISPAEADVMDPQHRVFLESAWHVLEHAGYGAGVGDDAVGVFAACSHDRYLIFNLLPHLYTESPHSIYQIMLGNDRDYLATRASYLLNLRGPSVNVQSACSSSLVAVHMACRSLLEGECDMALAGGVAIKIPQRSGYLYSEGMIVSPDGHCRAFDARANGTTWGSGIGIVMLKPLDRAIADRDTVYAVIKGSAVNNDGSLKVGFTAPGVDGQARVIAAAQHAAGVEPASISYVEAHGTGTQMGDPAEMAALSRAFGSRNGRESHCALGSVKSNIGHLDTAAGIAGLLKTTLALQHRQLPPSIHFSTPNRDIDFANSAFYVNDRLRDWNADGPRRAGVSSFGLGGTNAHIILEEAPAAEPASPSRDRQVIVFSGRADDTVDRMRDDLAAFFSSHPDVAIADAAFTQAVGRSRFPHRGAVVCRDAADAAAALSNSQRFRRGLALAAGAEVVFMFPGQGSQFPNMGERLYRDERIYREVIDECADSLAADLGIDLRAALYPAETETAAAAQRLNETWLTQPALFATEYALARLWMSWGITPAAMIGHSIGEYVAACLSGVFDLPTALKLVAARGRLMWQQPAGAMLAVAMPLPELEQRVPRELSVAAINAPRACVVAGPAPAIDNFAKALDASGVPSKRLKTSHAFHSAMMDGLTEPFMKVLSACNFGTPAIPFISNVTGAWALASEVTTPDYWVRHARGAVRFADGVSGLLADARRVFVEVGPGDALSRLARQQSGSDKSRVMVASMSEQSDVADALAELWIAGVDVDWQRYFGAESRRRIAMPLYPFARERHWINPPSASANRAGATAGNKKQPLERWFHLPAWSLSLPPAAVPPGRLPNGRWVILTNGSEFANRLIARLEREARSCVCVSERDRLSEVDWTNVEHIVHLWTLEESTRGYESLVELTQLLARRDDQAPLTITVVSTALHDVAGAGDILPERALMMGPCLVVPQEHTELTFKTIDIGAAALSADTLLNEIVNGNGEPHVAYRGRARFVPRFEQVELPGDAATTATLKDRGVYLITGGLGKVGLHLAELLFDTCNARLVLLSRHLRTPAKLAALQQRGAEILTIAADVASEDEMREAVRATVEHFGAINGVIHAAGALDDSSFTCPADSLDAAASSTQFRPKVEGVRVLERVLDGQPLDFCVLISSNAALLGGLGFTAYSAANRFMDAFAARHNRGDGTPWLSTNWDTWAFDAPGAALSMTSIESREAFRRILARMSSGQLMIATGDPAARFDQWVRRAGWTSPGEPTIRRAHTRPAHAGEIIAPSTASERVLVEVWKELFGFAAVSVDDDFFELGGDSLSGIRLMSMIKETAGKKLPLNVLLKGPTIRALAAEIDRDEALAPWSPLVPVAVRGSRPPFFCVPGTGGSVVYLRELARALGDHDRPFYAFQAPGLDGRTPPLDSVEALAAANVAALLEFQPSGPYFLGGHSFGSWVALEMAQQLKRLGRDVAMLAILDTAAPAERDLSAMAVRNDTQWLVVVANMLTHLFSKPVDLQLESLEGLAWPVQLERFADALIDGGVLPADADRAEIRGLVNVYRSQAQMRYRPAPGHAPVDLVLLRAAEPLADFVDGIPDAMLHDESWGWRDYALGGPIVEVVPGDHLTMMTRPHCHDVAAALHRILSSRETAGAAAVTGHHS
jgi:amino acid adenylation domain-containing protein